MRISKRGRCLECILKHNREVEYEHRSVCAQSTERDAQLQTVSTQHCRGQAVVLGRFQCLMLSVDLGLALL